MSVSADDVSLRLLLAEWARAGQLKLSGLDQVADRPVTLHLECADERRTLSSLLEGADPLLVPRDVPLDGASTFAAVAILGRDPSLPRRMPVGDGVPEVAYPDPMPGRDWSAVEPDADAPPPVSLRPVPGRARMTPSTGAPPEAIFEYARPVSTGPPLLPAAAEAERAPQQFEALAAAVRGGALPESLFDYTLPHPVAPDAPRTPLP